MTAATASSDQPADGVREETDRRLWRGAISFLLYLLTAGLYGIWWFFVSRQEMDEVLGRKRSPAIAFAEGVGQLIPMVSAFVWYRTITDINAARAKVRAPAVNLWGWVAAIGLSWPCIYILPTILGPLLDAFNPDMREIIKALGYALVPAEVLVFGYMTGYWNEYWMEKLGDRARNRRFGPVDIAFFALAILGVVGVVVLAVTA